MPVEVFWGEYTKTYHCVTTIQRVAGMYLYIGTVIITNKCNIKIVN